MTQIESAASQVSPRSRLLVPIDATLESRWPLTHALRRAAGGEQLEVCLAYLFEPVRSWEVLRFRTEREVREHFEMRAAVFLEEAAVPLRDAGIPSRALIREAAIVPGILDLAEQLACSEILVPKPSWLGLFCSGLGPRLRRAAGPVPVILVGADGVPDTPPGTMAFASAGIAR